MINGMTSDKDEENGLWNCENNNNQTVCDRPDIFTDCNQISGYDQSFSFNIFDEVIYKEGDSCMLGAGDRKDTGLIVDKTKGNLNNNVSKCNADETRVDAVEQVSASILECNEAGDCRVGMEDMFVATPLITCDSVSTENSLSEPVSEEVRIEASIENPDTNDEGNIYRGRKRTRNPDNWKRSIIKRHRNTGREYVNEKGVKKPAKCIKPGCGLKCRYKCHSFISSEEREKIFHKFWGLGDMTHQRQFILKHAEAKQKVCKTVPGNSRRSLSYTYTFPHGKTLVRVCKTFFLDTLNITGQMVQTACKKSEALPGVCAPDRRGRHGTKPNKTPLYKVNYIKEHINSFARIESHYCRKDSKKMYLSPGLSVPKMYNLYLEKCAKDGVQPATMSIYRSVFDHQFNLAFFKPIKDQCDICNSFRSKTTDISGEDRVIYQSHLENKSAARDEKQNDKLKAKSLEDEDFIAVCFDLEEVLMTPKGFESILFYKRRLNNFNLSFYDLGTGQVNCYLWNESMSGRGACEISSCIFDFIQKMANKGKKRFVFFSDNCGAQNKISTM